MRKIALGLVALTLTASVAMAQTTLNFTDIDLDGNGELSFTELQAVWPDLTQDEFAAADADFSGGLNAEELSNLQPAADPAAPVPDTTLETPVEPLGDVETGD